MRQVQPAAWDGLELDAYYRRRYVESACILEPGEPLLLEHEGTVFAAIRREVAGAASFDVITPYGYGGPAGGNPSAFWAAYDTWARDEGLVTTFVRFHPLYANHRDAPLHVEELAPTIAWRLDGDLLAGLHGKHRNALRKAKASVADVTAAGGLGGFVALYEETMRRAGATGFYFFAPAYWKALERTGMLIRFDAIAGGEVVASALCLASPPWLHYHLGAVSEAGRKLGATTLVLYEAAVWAQGRGYERFHLGGGVGGRRDSLHEFKRRFDPAGECEVAIGKLVHDEDTYRALGGDPTDLTGYFPAYRRESA
jgi:hypothetical protein